MKLFLRILSAFLALWLTTAIFSGAEADGLVSLAAAAAVLGLANSSLRPILHALTVPIGCITLGISSFLINVLMVWLSVTLIPGISFSGFFTHAVATVLVSLTSALISEKD